jgi:hypothetical protein
MSHILIQPMKGSWEFSVSEIRLCVFLSPLNVAILPPFKILGNISPHFVPQMSEVQYILSPRCMHCRYTVQSTLT